MTRNLRILTVPAALGLALLTACSLPPGSSASAAANIAPTLAPKQRQFCAAFQNEPKLMNDYQKRLAAAGDNPIAQQAAQKTQPDLDKILSAEEFAAMGDGSFQDWVGSLSLTAESTRAFVTVEFACPGTLPYVHDVLAFENEWRNGFAPRPVSAGIPLDSPLGQSLVKLHPRELVAASGTLSCQKGEGCYTNYPEPAPEQEFGATFTAIRSLK